MSKYAHELSEFQGVFALDTVNRLWAFDEHGTIRVQLSIQFTGLIDIFAQFFPKSRAVILDSGMHQFMQKGVIHQFGRQADEIDVKINIVVPRATAPACLLIAYEYFVVGKSVTSGEFGQPVHDDLSGDRSVDRGLAVEGIGLLFESGGALQLLGQPLGFLPGDTDGLLV